jgi:hypothetical protein
VATAGWIVLRGAAAAIGSRAGLWLAGPDGRDDYLAMSGIVGVAGVTPAAFVASFFLLLVKGRFIKFLVSGIVVGLAITLWPLPLWLFQR